MLCLLFIGFVFCFLFINYKWGVTATPVLQFGMFSGVFHIKDTQTVAQIYINDKPLNYADYSVAQRDKMTTYLSMYLSQKEINTFSFITMKRLLSKVGIGSLMQEQHYTNTITATNFSIWYKEMLEKITGEKINTLEVYNQKYLWDGNTLAPLIISIKIDSVDIK